MSSIQPCALPERALLGKYSRTGAYTDCYTTHIAKRVSHAEYVEAFYTTALFKLERFILARFVAKPSTDLQAKQLASGALEAFAAWKVEERGADQLLMADFAGRTRSWFMTAPAHSGGSAATHLYFGSAVVPMFDKATGLASMSFEFRALLGFHKLYSRLLLRAACSRLLSAKGPAAL
jgi:hypothetical protein